MTVYNNCILNIQKLITESTELQLNLELPSIFNNSLIGKYSQYYF